MRIAVVGTGYVGLVAGVCFADSGHGVVCVDVDEHKIVALRHGKSPIYEPGLDELLRKNTEAERLSFTTDLTAAVKQSEGVFIAVGPPQAGPGDGGERVGADVDSVRKAMGADERIGQKFLFPGCGYGGSCFPKDVKALIATARTQGLDFTLLSAVDAVNDRQKRLLAQKARAHFGNGKLRGKKLAVWGLAFKPKTDDVRHAPALALIDELLAEGAVVAAHDPVAMDNVRREFGDKVQFVNNPYLAVQGADGLFLVTEWNEFRQPDFARIKAAMRQPVLFDGRNIWNPARLRALGFSYYGVGRSA